MGLIRNPQEGYGREMDIAPSTVCGIGLPMVSKQALYDTEWNGSVELTIQFSATFCFPITNKE